MDKYSGPSVMGGIRWQSLALGSGVGVAATLAIMLGFAVVLASVDLPVSAPKIISTLCLGLGGLVGGFVSAKHNGRNGLIIGSATGLCLFLAIALVSLALGSDIGLMFILRLVVTLVLSATGGVLGINIRRKPKYF